MARNPNREVRKNLVPSAEQMRARGGFLIEDEAGRRARLNAQPNTPQGGGYPYAGQPLPTQPGGTAGVPVSPTPSGGVDAGGGQPDNTRRAPPTQPNYGLGEPMTSTTGYGAPPTQPNYGIEGDPSAVGDEDPTMMDMLQSMLEEQQAQQEEIKRQIGASYDKQKEAILGQKPIMKEAAQRTQGNIGDFYGYAAEQAKAGRAPIQQAYVGAQATAEEAYGEAREQVAGTPEQYAELAKQAGGAGAGEGVAERVAQAAGPFDAALASGQASVKGNLAQSQAAGESYLGQLAAAAPSEAAQQQAQVSTALNQQLQDLQLKAAQLEGEKQRAMLQASNDASGDVFDRMMKMQRLEMAKEKHEKEMAEAERGEQDPMAGMDLRERLKTRRLQQEMTDPRQQDNPQEALDMFLNQQFGDQPSTQQIYEQLAGLANQRIQEPDASHAGVIQDLVSQLQAPDQRQAVGTEADPRMGLAKELGLDSPARIYRLDPAKARRAMRLLTGVYTE